MAEIPKLEEVMDCGPLPPSSRPSKLGEMGTQKISILDQTNGLQCTNAESDDSFIVDMERFSHTLPDRDMNPNSRITLHRSFSRKGSQRGSEKRLASNIGSEKDTSTVASSSPRGGAGNSTPDKSTVMTMGATDNPINPQLLHHHHQITIMPAKDGGTAAAAAAAGGKRSFSFRRSPPPQTWGIDPRRILLFFATLSSMGSILLIYFTLYMNKLGGDDSSALD